MNELTIANGETFVSEQNGTLQEMQLQTDEGQRVAFAEAYLQPGFYGVHWYTQLSVERQVELINACLDYYEETFADGVSVLGGKTDDPKGKESNDEQDSESKMYQRGIIIYAQNGKTEETERETYQDYRRPLAWAQIRKEHSDNEVSFVRINTPIGDFFPTLNNEESVGFLSHLAEINGLAQLIAQTSGSISQEQAEDFLKAVVALFSDTQQSL